MIDLLQVLTLGLGLPSIGLFCGAVAPQWRRSPLVGTALILLISVPMMLFALIWDATGHCEYISERSFCEPFLPTEAVIVMGVMSAVGSITLTWAVAAVSHFIYRRSGPREEYR